MTASFTELEGIITKVDVIEKADTSDSRPENQDRLNTQGDPVCIDRFELVPMETGGHFPGEFNDFWGLHDWEGSQINMEQLNNKYPDNMPAPSNNVDLNPWDVELFG